jgi:3-oxoacyl-[acyl-carrier-protein] synthase-3
MAISFVLMAESISVASVYLHGIGHFHPENVIDNEFLASLDIGADPDWIVDRVGIQQRRTVLDLDYIRTTLNNDLRAADEAAAYSNAEMGANAASAAIEKAGLSSESVGMVISGACTSDYNTPAVSAEIAAILKITAPVLDINSACSTFGAHIHFLSCMQPQSLPEYILLVIPESSTKSIDYSDRSTAVLWGDGAVAVVVSLSQVSNIRIDATEFDSDPSGWNKVMFPRLQAFHQEGRAVQNFAIRQMSKSYQKVAEQFQGNPEQHYFIAHQANLTMLSSVCSRCEIPLTQHKYNIHQFGNTGAAGAPSVLSQSLDQFKAGDQIAMVVVGAGLSWAGMRISFT